MLKQFATARAPSPTRDPPTQRFGVAGARAPRTLRSPRRPPLQQTSAASRSLFLRGGANQFLEARIFAEWVKHWIEPQQGGSERRVCGQGRLVWDRKQLGQGGDSAVRIADASRDPGEDVQRPRTRQRVFLNRNHGDRALGQSQCSDVVAKTHAYKRQISHQNKIFRLFFEERLQFAASLTPTFAGGGMVAGNFLCPA